MRKALLEFPLQFFEPCPYTWVGEIFQFSWSLEISIFSIFFLLNLEYTWTFISAVGIFVSWKFEITKNSTRIASVMKLFYTLLQCRVRLSMFHSSSTSKIWYTCTKHDLHWDGAKAQSCVVQDFCTNGTQSLLSLSSKVEKNFSFHFKRYNVTICAVNFSKKKFTCSPSIIG